VEKVIFLEVEKKATLSFLMEKREMWNGNAD